MGNVTVDREKFYERLNNFSFSTSYDNCNDGIRLKNNTEILRDIKRMFDACIVMASSGSFTNETNSTIK